MLQAGPSACRDHSTRKWCEEPKAERGKRNDDGAPTASFTEAFELTERATPDAATAEAVRDLWEAELALERADTRQTSEETRLATLMQDAPIPIISSPPERTWIWSDLHLADRSALATWNRPFRNIEEMNHHLLEGVNGRWKGRHSGQDGDHNM